MSPRHTTATCLRSCTVRPATIHAGCAPATRNPLPHLDIHTRAAAGTHRQQCHTAPRFPRAPQEWPALVVVAPLPTRRVSSDGTPTGGPCGTTTRPAALHPHPQTPGSPIATAAAPLHLDRRRPTHPDVPRVRYLLASPLVVSAGKEDELPDCAAARCLRSTISPGPPVCSVGQGAISMEPTPLQCFTPGQGGGGGGVLTSSP